MTMAPGWYDDVRGALRWWDGSQWTEHVATPDPDSADAVEPELPPELAEPPAAPSGSGGAFLSATEPRKSRQWIVWVVTGVVLLGIVITLAVLVPMLFLSRASVGASPQFNESFDDYTVTVTAVEQDGAALSVSTMD